MYVLVGGVIIGYFMANTLIDKQPWKLAYNLGNSI